MADTNPASFSFNKTGVENLSLPPKGQRATYRDPKVRGLQLRITSTGQRTFSLYRRIKNGAPERITLGRFPEMTIEQARRRATELNARIEGSENPAAAKRALRDEPTFSELFGYYLNKHAKLRKRTWDEDQEKFDNHLKKWLGSKKISSITRDDIRAIHRRITDAGSPIAANRVLALLSKIFSWASAQDIAVNNLTKGIARNQESSRDRFLSGDELPRFFNALALEPNELFRDYFMMLLLTGARRSNLAAMRWDEISWDSKLWRIPLTKNGTPQFVSLDDPEELMLTILKRRRDTSESCWVFPSVGKLGHIVEPHKPWRRVIERAGIENLRVHDLRRTLGSWMAGTGASTTIIGKQLNHKSVAATQVYARLELDPVNRARNSAVTAILEAGRKDSTQAIESPSK